MADKVRSRLWCLLLYPDDDSHLNALDIIRSSYSYVGILHDKDTWSEEDEINNAEHKLGELKKPHYHIIIKFAQPRWNTAVSDELGIALNYFEPCRSFKNAGVYLVHSGIDDKYQYDGKYYTIAVTGGTFTNTKNAPAAAEGYAVYKTSNGYEVAKKATFENSADKVAVAVNDVKDLYLVKKRGL